MTLTSRRPTTLAAETLENVTLSNLSLSAAGDRHRHGTPHVE